MIFKTIQGMYEADSFHVSTLTEEDINIISANINCIDGHSFEDILKALYWGKVIVNLTNGSELVILGRYTNLLTNKFIVKDNIVEYKHMKSSVADIVVKDGSVMYVPDSSAFKWSVDHSKLNKQWVKYRTEDRLYSIIKNKVMKGENLNSTDLVGLDYSSVSLDTFFELIDFSTDTLKLTGLTAVEKLEFLGDLSKPEVMDSFESLID